MKRHFYSSLALLTMIAFALGSVQTSDVAETGYIETEAPESPASDVRKAVRPDPSVSIIEARLEPFQSPTTGRQLQKVFTTWKNVGNTPIRAVEARLIFRDENGDVIESHDYTLYAVFDADRGVLPGETYTTPQNAGFIFPNSNVTADAVEVIATESHEHFGM